MATKLRSICDPQVSTYGLVFGQVRMTRRDHSHTSKISLWASKRSKEIHLEVVIIELILQKTFFTLFNSSYYTLVCQIQEWDKKR